MGRKRNFISKFGKDAAELRKKLKKSSDDFSSFPTLSVLMFHHIEKDLPKEPWLKNLTVSPEKLAEIIELFSKSYTFVTLSEAKEVFSGKKSLKNPHMICLTFDDGYKDFLEFALPVLEKHNIKANLNVVGKFVEEEYEDFLSWDELKKIQKTGLVEIDSHTYDFHRKIHDHPAILFSKKQEIIKDADKIDALFEKHLGFRPQNLILPYGATILGLGRILKGRYNFIAITNSGTNTKYSNPNLLRRFSVLESESSAQLLSIVDGYLDLEYAKYGIIYS